jgi:flavin reductase (DIM6/NTAB) family NADH-FMN oxidoreductase RutF
MAKVEIGAKPFLYPMPTTIVGANVNGKPNYLTIAYCAMVNSRPPLIAVSLEKSHYTNPGIKENGTFSVNIPSAALMEATDYVGIVSGHRVDKSTVFEAFYGKLGTAPMVKECPLNLECKLVQTLPLVGDEVFIGEIVAVYSEEQYLTNGIPDIRKLDPIIFSIEDDNYWRLGEHLGKAFKVGKGYKARS